MLADPTLSVCRNYGTLIEEEGLSLRGTFIIDPEGKLKAYELQENGRDTVEANTELGFNADDRDYGIGAQIIRAMNVTKIKLLSNNPKKRVGLIGYGIEIIETVPIEIQSNEHNKLYLETKRDKMGHSLKNLDE